MVVVKQHFGDFKSISDGACSNKIVGADNGSAAFPHIFRSRQLVQNIARFIKQVAANDIWGATINQIPIVDSIVAPDIKIEQLLSALLAYFFATSLPIHNTNRAHPYLMNRAFEQFLDFDGRHFNELFGKREDLPHAHANELIAFAVLAGAGFEVALNLLQFFRRTVRFQLLDKLRGGHSYRHITSFPWHAPGESDPSDPLADDSLKRRPPGLDVFSGAECNETAILGEPL